MESTFDKRISLIEHDLNLFMQQTNAKINKLEDAIAEQDKRIKDMEMYKEITEYQYNQIIENLKTLNEKTIPDLTVQIQELKNKPVKRYEQFIAGVIGAIAGATGAFIAGLFLKK